MGGEGQGTEEINNSEMPIMSVWRKKRQVGAKFHLRSFRILEMEQILTMRQIKGGGRKAGWLLGEKTEATGQREAKE